MSSNACPNKSRSLNSYPISYDRLEAMLQFLLEPVALQDVDDAQVEHDPVTMDTTLDVPLPETKRNTSLRYK